MTKRVVITGIGVIAPGAINKEQLWSRVSQGVVAGNTVTRFDVSGNNSKIVAEIESETIGMEYLDKSWPAYDRSTLLASYATHMAVEDSGLLKEQLVEGGVCIGTAIGGVDYFEKGFLRLTEGLGYENSSDTPMFVPVDRNRATSELLGSFMASSTSHRLAAEFGMGGPVTTMTTGCTAGIDAIGYAYECIQNNEVPIMITGGSDAPINKISFCAFDIINALTVRNDEPTKASLPYHEDRGGFLLAEGCGIFILEELEHAQKRGAKIYAEVLGFGTTCNAYHMTGLPSDGKMLAHAISESLQEANLSPNDINYINSHGSGTKQNDSNETAAFKLSLGKDAYNIPISSSKSMVGHSLGAASAVELVISVLSMVHNFVTPTANLDKVDPQLDLDYVPMQGREFPISYVLKDASGFSGIHSAIVLGRLEQ